MQVCTKTKPAMSSACDRILRRCVLVPRDLLTLVWQYDKIMLIFILSANWFLIYKFHDIVLSYKKPFAKTSLLFCLLNVNQRKYHKNKNKKIYPSTILSDKLKIKKRIMPHHNLHITEYFSMTLVRYSLSR